MTEMGAKLESHHKNNKISVKIYLHCAETLTAILLTSVRVFFIECLKSFIL
jgi:hypothetical protein